MAPRDRKHIELKSPATAYPYTSHNNGRTKKAPVPPDRRQHGLALQASLRAVEISTQSSRSEARAAGRSVEAHGIYVEVESVPGVALKMDSLDNRTSGIEVVSFREEVSGQEEQRVQRATLFVPDGAVRRFLEKFDAYAATPAQGEPPDPPRKIRHHDTFDRLAAVRRATLRALWTDDVSLFPTADEPIWWEVWLRVTDHLDEERFRRFAKEAGVDVDDNRLKFDDRVVVLVRARPGQLAASIDVLDAVAELRGVRAVASGMEKLSAIEQREYVDEALERLQVAAGDLPAVCILDTGINREHPLLRPFLDEADIHTLKPTWGLGDHDGHGTQMAGLALFGDLSQVVVGTGAVDVRHRLESVKLLPPGQSNKPELYGALTADAVARPEITNPTRRRVFSMAVTAPTDAASHMHGAPTSWSAAVDKLAMGRLFGDEPLNPRLIVISGGNVDQYDVQHLDRSDLSPIEDPAQAFNALTVGACTHLERLVETDWPGAVPVARADDLSPHSRTSTLFNDMWPLKPDVVFEGSNVFHLGGFIETYPVPSLNVMTTSSAIPQRFFDFSSGTSAATAQVARMAARISAEYPSLWPETLRGLIVHSARWTSQMKLNPHNRRNEVERLIRRYGYGVPSEERALRSARDDLTLMHQGLIHPFKDGKLHEMHLHELPWPRQALLDLGETEVTLRVTLSYFVEPNPARRGQKTRFQYASHGLRFDMKKPEESDTAFLQRLNKREVEEGQTPDRRSNIGDWKIRLRTSGSVHSDSWTGTAAALAARDRLSVCPVSGWWNEVPKRDRSADGVRYALLVSIEAPDVEVDLWTEVMNAITTPIEV